MQANPRSKMSDRPKTGLERLATELASLSWRRMNGAPWGADEEEHLRALASELRSEVSRVERLTIDGTESEFLSALKSLLSEA